MSFQEIGILREKTAKNGKNYWSGAIDGVPVVIFPQDDGSLKVFTRADAPATPQRTEPDQGQEYTKTLDGVGEIPDPGEPMRRRRIIHC
jgi:hypothetical protein